MMRKGQLMRWNDEKGFGFIRSKGSDEDIFLHISSLQGTGRRPEVGDVILFKLVADNSGRNKAVNASIEGVESVFAERKLENRIIQKNQQKSRKSISYPAGDYKPKNSGSWISTSLVVIVILFFAVTGFNKFNERDLLTQSPSEANAFAVQEEVANPVSVSQFKCEGKTRCSQMISCDEAMFYLNHCPGSVTDGDGDGRPCEDQWCGH